MPETGTERHRCSSHSRHTPPRGRFARSATGLKYIPNTYLIPLGIIDRLFCRSGVIHCSLTTTAHVRSLPFCATQAPPVMTQSESPFFSTLAI